MTNIYESEIFSRLTDHAMHPGGLRLTDRAVRLAGLHNGMAVADIGCGAGSTAAYLMRKYGLIVTGLEISEPLIRIARQNHPGPRFIQRDCGTLPFAPESLDAALFECSLSVIGYDGRTLADCASALVMNGRLIISDLFTKRTAHNPPALPAFEVLESRLAAAGFAVDIQEDHTPALITYAAELSEQFGKDCDAGRFVCSRFAEGFRLSDHCYTLIVARKTGT